MPDYGNVSEEDIEAIQSAPEAAGRIVERLSPALPLQWQAITYELVLDGILQDWVSNGTTELDEEDEEDIANLARAALDSALAQEESLQAVTYRVSLKHVMNDWVHNWNAEE
jgi:hypothetical protein